jgi:UDP-N-acetylmuramyl pentapeptide phosphotransferase/UDP-N-acetylglucosamine-1-phosphate transferase
MLLSIMLVAIFNVYNFMDGINGMNGLYSLAVIIPLLLSEKNIPLQSLEIYIVLALIVFLFFNCRRTAVCFSGDVGSITLSVMLSFLILRRIVNTENLAYIGLLLIYGIDASFTILRRLLKGENIFRAHRTHLYQFLCNELKIPHVQVSEAYALLQFIIGLGIVYNFVDLSGLIIIAAILSLIYLFLKKRILSTISSNGPLKPTELP